MKTKLATEVTWALHSKNRHLRLQLFWRSLPCDFEFKALVKFSPLYCLYSVATYVYEYNVQ